MNDMQLWIKRATPINFIQLTSKEAKVPIATFDSAIDKSQLHIIKTDDAFAIANNKGQLQLYWPVIVCSYLSQWIQHIALTTVDPDKTMPDNI